MLDPSTRQTAAHRLEERQMKLRTRLGVTIATAALGAVGLLGTAACSPTAGSDQPQTMSPEATALTALGFSDTDVTGDNSTTGDGGVTGVSATATPSAGSNARRANHPRWRRLLIRRALGRHVEHGQVTVETKNGDRTFVVQRGVITALNSTGMTVKSTDGFTLTWTFDPSMRVIEHRTTVQPSDVKAGETVGVAGLLDGSQNDAKLIVIPVQGK
jgi:hypothetical protein